MWDSNRRRNEDALRKYGPNRQKGPCADPGGHSMMEDKNKHIFRAGDKIYRQLNFQTNGDGITADMAEIPLSLSKDQSAFVFRATTGPIPFTSVEYRGRATGIVCFCHFDISPHTIAFDVVESKLKDRPGQRPTEFLIVRPIIGTAEYLLDLYRDAFPSFNTATGNKKFRILVDDVFEQGLTIAEFRKRVHLLIDDLLPQGR